MLIVLRIYYVLLTWKPSADNLILGRPRREIPPGPAVTVFVGNITERAPDAMVRHLLTTCGPVVSWKRVQGATGKLQVLKDYF